MGFAGASATTGDEDCFSRLAQSWFGRRDGQVGYGGDIGRKVSGGAVIFVCKWPWRCDLSV